MAWLIESIVTETWRAETEEKARDHMRARVGNMLAEGYVCGWTLEHLPGTGYEVRSVFTYDPVAALAEADSK